MLPGKRVGFEQPRKSQRVSIVSHKAKALPATCSRARSRARARTEPGSQLCYNRPASPATLPPCADGENNHQKDTSAEAAGRMDAQERKATGREILGRPSQNSLRVLRATLRKGPDHPWYCVGHTCSHWVLTMSQETEWRGPNIILHLRLPREPASGTALLSSGR